MCAAPLSGTVTDGDLHMRGASFNRTQGQLARKAEDMRFGSVFVSTTVPLKTPLFEEISRQTMQMSWGTCTVFIQRRKRLGKWVAGVLGRK